MIVKHLGLVGYEQTYAAMQAFTATRQPLSLDELWLCEHRPVYTQGLAGKPEHLMVGTDIPIVHTDRGGQITYHGPGQVVAYPLINLHRLGIFVKEYVFKLESAALSVLAHYGVTGHRVLGAPGIYVRLNDPFSHALLPKSDAKAPDFAGLAKIAALGIKVTKGCTYHGLAINVAMDLQPFAAINPCGYAALHTVDLRSLGVQVDPAEFGGLLSDKLVARLAV